jgi:hypothetical protein
MKERAVDDLRRQWVCRTFVSDGYVRRQLGWLLSTRSYAEGASSDEHHNDAESDNPKASIHAVLPTTRKCVTR